MAGRARLSSARRAAVWGVQRRAEDRRALPPAVTEALLQHGNNFDAKPAHVSLVVMRILAHQAVIACAASKRRFPSVPILAGSLLMLGWAAHALDVDEIVTRHTEALGG